MKWVREFVGMLWTWIKGLFRAKQRKNSISWLSILKNFEVFEAKKLARLASLAVLVLGIYGSYGVGIVAAEDNGTSGINWTALGEMVKGFADIMPDVANLVMAVVPILVILIFVAFFRNMLEKIVGLIKGGLKF
ncbi:hypothetical protein DRP05_01070 [Archaeoglobales archaeon]|nr:MAG: hypothetical protein DRP05_01070 [Archaeoglobales archaeon]